MLQFAIADFGHTSVVALAFSLVGLELELLHLLLVALNLIEECFLALPFGTLLLLVGLEGVDNLAEFGKLLFVALALDGLALNFQLLQPAAQFVNLFGHRIALHAEFGGGFVHQVDGLVGQEAVGDVAVAEFYGGNDGFVLDAHLVVVLVTFLQAAEDGDGRGHVRLINHHGLESTLQGFVFLKVLLVFIQGGSTNGTQFSTSQRWLEDVGCVHGSACLPSTHQGVNFVDEEDDLPLTLHHNFHHAFKPFLKLALIFGTSNEGAHVERVKLLVLQVFRHIATDDTPCQSLHNGGLARSWFADKDWVVFCTATKNLQDSTNLLVTSDDGIELTILSTFHEVRCI